MDAREFTKEMTGQLVRIPNGPPDIQIGFVPNPLPPKWSWPERLWSSLVAARSALASLDGVGKHLPNPEILIWPLQRREAQLSSQLEGTITNPQQQVLFEADPKYPISPSDPANAYREVFNYREALRLRLDGRNQLPLSLRLMRDLHTVLMDGVRGSNQQPGQFRTIQNQIGRPARFVPPPPSHLPRSLPVRDHSSFLRWQWTSWQTSSVGYDRGVVRSFESVAIHESVFREKQKQLYGFA